MQKDFWVKNGVLGEIGVQRNIQVKDGVWGKMGMQKDFWVKNRVLLEKTNSLCRKNPSCKN